MEKQSSHFLSLIIPAYRQDKTLLSDVSEIEKVLQNIRYDFEIIVVLDGSEKKPVFRNRKIRLIYYKNNHGKAHAIRTGMNHSKGDFVMFLDAGQEIDPNGISMLLEHMEWYSADVIVGSKRHLASLVNYPFQRRILSFGYYYFVKLLFGIRVHDTQAGIKVFRKTVLKKILPRLREKKFAGDLEMLVVADSLGFKRIYEAPIKLNYHFANLTSAATMKSIIGILIDTLAIWWRKNVLKSYL